MKNVLIVSIVLLAKTLRADRCDIEKLRRQKTKFVEWFDMDRLAFPLIVRRRKDGDRFQPFGSDSQKKVGKFLTAERLERKDRADVVIIADAEKIIWLAPVRAAEQTKITAATQRILQVKIEQA